MVGYQELSCQTRQALEYASYYVVLSKEFDLVLLTNKAKDFRRYLLDVRIPEKYIFASL